MQRAYKDLIKLYADRAYTGKSISLDNVSHSRPREFEILGETVEIGEGEKSPDNPFTLVGAVSPAVTVNGQTLPMVGRNLYEPVAENFSTLDLRIILSDNCVEIKNLNLTNEQWIGFYYSRKDLFQVKTKYTVVVEVLEAIYTGNVSINVFSFYTVNNTKDVFNTSQQLKNPTAGIYKITRTTISDFTNIAYAMRSRVYVAAGASLTSLKFRISIYRADDVDLDIFAYEPYQDTFELNSAGSVADTYNPLTGEYVQRVGVKILADEEDENWQLAQTNEENSVFRLVCDSTVIYNNNILCNILQFKGEAGGYAAALDRGIGLYRWKSGGVVYLYFVVPLTVASSLTEWDTYLQENPITVYYELAEPVTTIINQTTLQANIPDTTISLTEANNLGSLRAVLQTKGE